MNEALRGVIEAMVQIEPAMVRRSGGQNWFVCNYCAARSIRQPVVHRSGCAWQALKVAWENFPTPATDEPEARGGGG